MNHVPFMMAPSHVLRHSAAAAGVTWPDALTPPLFCKALTRRLVFGKLNIFPSVAWDPQRSMPIPHPLQHTWPWLQKLEALRYTDRCQSCHGRTVGRGHSWWGMHSKTPKHVRHRLTPAHLQPSGGWICHPTHRHALSCCAPYTFHPGRQLCFGNGASDCSVHTKTYSGPHIQYCIWMCTCIHTQ